MARRVPAEPESKGSRGACEKHIERSLELADALIVHSDEALVDCEDDRLLTLNGVIRDCGMKIRQMTLALMVEQREESAGPDAKRANRAI